jgi:hypothetical protein
MKGETMYTNHRLTVSGEEDVVQKFVTEGHTELERVGLLIMIGSVRPSSWRTFEGHHDDYRNAEAVYEFESHASGAAVVQAVEAAAKELVPLTFDLDYEDPERCCIGSVRAVGGGMVKHVQFLAYPLRHDPQVRGGWTVTPVWADGHEPPPARFDGEDVQRMSRVLDMAGADTHRAIAADQERQKVARRITSAA